MSLDSLNTTEFKSGTLFAPRSSRPIKATLKVVKIELFYSAKYGRRKRDRAQCLKIKFTTVSML